MHELFVQYRNSYQSPKKIDIFEKVNFHQNL